jgi:hypothetical protein
MTTQYIVLKGLPNGLTFGSGKLVSAPDTLVSGNTFSFSNRTNANTQYVVSVVRSAVLAAGDYTFIAYIGSDPKAEIAVTFAGTDGETATETAKAAELDSALETKIEKLNFNDNDALNVNVMYYNDSPQSNGDLPLKIDAVQYAVNDVKTKTDQLVFNSGAVNSNITHWKGSAPGNLDSNGFAPANVAAINGNTTRVSTFSTWLDNNRLDAALTTVITVATSGLATQSSVDNLPQYGDTQRHTQDTFNLEDKSVDVIVTKVT